MMSRTLEDKVEMICLLGSVNHNFHEAERQYNAGHPERPACRKYLRELVTKFRRTGSVNNDNSNKTARSVSPVTEMEIMWEMVEDPQVSASAISKKYDVPQATVLKYFKKNEYHAQMIRKKMNTDQTPSSQSDDTEEIEDIPAKKTTKKSLKRKHSS